MDSLVFRSNKLLGIKVAVRGKESGLSPSLIEARVKVYVGKQGCLAPTVTASEYVDSSLSIGNKL
jgi:hypothetical protein